MIGQKRTSNKTLDSKSFSRKISRGTALSIQVLPINHISNGLNQELINQRTLTEHGRMHSCPNLLPNQQLRLAKNQTLCNGFNQIQIIEERKYDKEGPAHSLHVQISPVYLLLVNKHVNDSLKSFLLEIIRLYYSIIR